MFPFLTATRLLMQQNCRQSNRMQQQYNSLQNVRFIMNGRMCKVFPRLKRFPLVERFFKEVPVSLKRNSVYVVRNCVAQVEFVVAFRIRRSLQIFALYSRLWNESPIVKFFHQIKKLALKRAREMLVAAVAVKFDWDQQRITEDEMKSHVGEFEICKFLREGGDCGHNDETKKDCPPDDGWIRFVHEGDISVWKKEIEPGLFTYKIYARYHDVRAIDFFELYLDLDNRKTWDDNVVQLKTIESETSSNSDIIYWETKWPKFFTNRDYVYNRRWMVDDERKVMVIKSKSTSHPKMPLLPNKARVTAYWSYVVIKPFTEFNEPGIEFCLTYFDNPGVHLPSSLTLWITVTGLPNYLKRLRIESLKLYEKKLLKEQEDLKRMKEEEELRRIKEEEEELRRIKEEEEERLKEPEKQVFTEPDNNEEKEKKEEPPREPPKDEGRKKEDPDDVFIYLTSFAQKIKEAIIEILNRQEKYSKVTSKHIHTSLHGYHFNKHSICE